MAVASTVLTTAIIIVLPKDVSSALFSNNFTYQSSENPCQVKYGFLVVALKELTITTTIGINRNIYTSIMNMVFTIFLPIIFDFLLIYSLPYC